MVAPGETNDVRDDVPYIHRPRRKNSWDVIYCAEDASCNSVPVGEVVSDRDVGFRLSDIDSIVEPAEVVSRLLYDIYVIRDICKTWVAGFDALESVDADYLVFAVDHVAALLRTALDKVFREAYT
jgi:hypothetical protein